VNEENRVPVDPDQLSAIPVFATLDDEDRARLAAVLSERSVELGAVLTTEGEISSRFFVIAEGRVAVTAGTGFVSLLGPGDILGEIGSMRGPRRSANAVAITKARLFTTMSWDLRDLAAEMPELDRRLNEIIDRRLADLESVDPA
jgi:CRP-like cAMP-binding protein